MTKAIYNTTIPRLWDPGFGWFPLSPILVVKLKTPSLFLKLQNSRVISQKIRNFDRNARIFPVAMKLALWLWLKECWKTWTKLEIIYTDEPSRAVAVKPLMILYQAF